MSRTILVVGARGGVGMAVSKLLAERGYSVIGTVSGDSDREQLQSDVPGLNALLILDLADADAVERALTHALKNCAELYGVIFCAAICPYGPLETTSLASLRRTLEINTVADVAVYRACMPSLRATRGRFIFVGSMSGKFATPFIGHYVASKFALEGLVDVMRRESSKWDVKVILIEPGGIKTKMVFNQIESIQKDIDKLTPEIQSLYGDLYGKFQRHLNGVHGATSPHIVAETILHALETADPEPRYQVGRDCIDTLKAVRNSSDKELDAYLRDNF